MGNRVIPMTVSLGASKTALAIGYRILNLDGTTFSAFTTSGVSEDATILGTYSVANGVTVPEAGCTMVFGTSGTDIFRFPIAPVAPTVALIRAEMDSNSTQIAAIKIKTDGLPSDPADHSLVMAEIDAVLSAIAALNNLSSAGAQAAATAALAAYGAATGAAVAAVPASVRAEVDGNSTQLAKLGTPAGASISADIAAIRADTHTNGVVLSTSQMQSLADIILGRSVSFTEATAGLHSLAELILALLESSTASGQWVIKRTDGTTTFNTRIVTTDGSALPIVGVS